MTMRLDPATSLLCVIDVQERLLAAMPDGRQVVERATRLASAAALLGVRTVLTEQYPSGLGPTIPSLAAKLPPPMTKMSFSCLGCEGFVGALPPAVGTAVLCGLETHVCILQTGLDLLARGWIVFVAVDAVASRHRLDHDTAVARLAASGGIPTTTEAVLFEWCRSAYHPQFQTVRRLVLDR